jgi:hypothetical protein
MTTDLALRIRTSDTPVVITEDQADLIKRTLAAEATDAELALFFYDCRRRGVHPLDKLIHFTKRKGKYTPVTSIDFFRSRAAATGAHMGTTDPEYTGTPDDPSFAATITVFRLVQGQTCAFTATARYVEYLPDAGNDFMFRKMPHNQIGKCAEALALRKAFPQELDGLHTVDELARDGGDAAPAPTPAKTVRRASSAATASASSAPIPAMLVTGAHRIKDVRPFGKDRANFAITLVDDDAAREYTTKDAPLALELEHFKGTDHAIRLTYETKDWNGKTYHNIKSFTVDAPAPEAAAPEPKTPPADPPLTAGQIPFSR